MSAMPTLVPSNTDAEEAINGCLLMGVEPERVMDILSPQDFHREANGWIYDAVLSVHRNGKGVDYLTVKDELVRRGKLDECEQSVSLVSLITNLPHAAFLVFDDYVGIVKEMSVRRRLITAGSNIAALAYKFRDGVTLADICAQAEIALTDATTEWSPNIGPVLLSDALLETLEYMQEVRTNQGKPRTIPTGWPEVDRILTGWGRGQLIAVAGRPGMGKSGFMLRAAAMAAATGTPTTMFSLEMGRTELVNRLLCASTEIPLPKLARPDLLTGHDMDKIKRVMSTLANYPLYLDDRCDVNVQEVMATVARQRRQHAVEFVVIDYVQLLDDAGDDDEAVKTLGKLTRSLKKFARKHDIPVMLGVQLNRSCESRNNKRPLLSDFRGSGRIEEDIDTALMLYRDDYYTEMPKKPERSEAEVLVRKQRGGETGVAYLDFVRHKAWFESNNLPHVQAA